jgi:hypothetical protein
MEKMDGGNSRRLTVILVGIIAVLVLILLYAFVVRPSINGYAVKLQTEGVDYALSAILSQIQQNGYVQIPVGNQTLTLVPYIPSQSSATTAG